MIRAFVRSRSGLAGLFLIGLLLALVVLGPLAFGGDANSIDLLHTENGPSWHHLLGTDRLGRDLLARILTAARLSLGLAAASAAVAAAIGIPFGAVTALLPPLPRSMAMRAIDTMLAFPGLLIAIFIAAILGPSGQSAALGVGIALSAQFARVSSTLALSIGKRDYVAAAKVTGIGRTRRLFRYILPNMAEALAIMGTVAISNSILFVASLSFLGLGVQPPTADWGNMLTDGVKDIYVSPAGAAGPACAIAFSAIAFGFVGEALARSLNPMLWAQRGDTVSVISEPAAPIEGLAQTVHVNGDQPNTGTPRRPGDIVLEVSDLRVSFGSMNVVDGVSFTLEKAQTLGIVGESGSGKTMTAMAVAQLVPYPGVVSGTVTLQGKQLDKVKAKELTRLLGTKLAVVFQDPLSSLNPALRLGTQLMEGTITHRHIRRAEARALAADRLAEVNLPMPEQQLGRYPHELSGGMRQRVMIAMGLMNEPAVLIADEPTTALDVTIQAQIMDVLAEINAKHDAAVILISHNLSLVSQNCQRVIVMYAGRVVEELTAEQLLQRPLHPYTAALIAATPEISVDNAEPLRSIPGHIPEFSNLPTGCPYHPRCPLAMAHCSVEHPPLRWVNDNQRVACWAAFGGDT